MVICNICGAPRADAEPTCPYDKPEEQAPWQGDYEAMAASKMTHDEHTLVVARWGLHNAASQSAKAMERFHSKVNAAWGREQQLFLLDPDGM